MGSYEIKVDDLRQQFQSEFPIYLQNIISPNEFTDLISRCNAIYRNHFSSLRKLRIINTIAIAIGGLIFGFSMPIFIFTFQDSDSFIFVPIILCAVFFSFIFGITFFMVHKRKQKVKMGMEELRRCLAQANNQKFYSRGVQFQVATEADIGGLGYGGNRRNQRYAAMRPVIQVNLSSSVMNQNNNNNNNNTNNHYTFTTTTTTNNGFAPNQYNSDANFSSPMSSYQFQQPQPSSFLAPNSQNNVDPSTSLVQTQQQEDPYASTQKSYW